VKKSLRIKSLTLLLLLAVSIFPFKVFCHTEDSKDFNSISISQESSHHDCPFCSFQFYHEFEQSQNVFVSTQEIILQSVAFNFTTQVVSFSKASKNKGPPIQFL
jgi:hypothetical protein